MPNKLNEVDFQFYQYPGVQINSPIFHMFYSEKLLVGYRYYDAMNYSFTTGFPFGHGLSYTSFEYSGLAIKDREVSFSVKNVGQMAGAEVAQLYLEFPQEAGE